MFIHNSWKTTIEIISNVLTDDILKSRIALNKFKSKLK